MTVWAERIGRWTDEVTGRAGTELAGSLYAVPEPDRLAAAAALGEAGLWIHADVIVGRDGGHRGVHPRTVGDVVAAGVGRVDVHLIARDLTLLDELIGLGADRVTVPLETVTDLAATAARIRAAGAAAWVALAPDVPHDRLLADPPVVDGVLTMLITPGTRAPARPELVDRAGVLARGLSCGVDGGLTPELVPACLAAGVSYLVVGRSLLGHPATIDPTTIDPAMIDPAMIDPTMIDPTTTEPATTERRIPG
ncbi:hypothetical protein ACIGG9_28310 [Pseudonocardia alni]|uniref:hypothetical protein n=1 Tax=Pseudonocardia alni TaxID=33907 RepID=UPI0033F43879